MSDDSGNKLDQHQHRVHQQTGLRPAYTPARRAIHIRGRLKVDCLQPFGGSVDARGVSLGILSGYAKWNHEIGILRRIGGGCIHEEVSSTSDDRRLEAIDSGHEIVELATGLASSEERAPLPKSSGELESSAVSLLAAMRVERFLLLLKGFLCHPASMIADSRRLPASPVI